ncbi:MAG: peroxiredoxin [Proteobacteria bacterium]|nr:peroxiredoxin [Pseudomonadota bacterium]
MIKVGDKFPSATLKVMGPDGPKDVSTDEFFKGRKVALFGVPGAFTPGCSAKHLPGFVMNADKIKAKGVSEVACVAVNDVFVMDAWGKVQNTAGKVTMLADGSGKLAKSLGLELDLVERGLGVRSRRYAMIVDNGVVKTFNLEEGTGVDKSSAETLLKGL